MPKKQLYPVKSSDQADTFSRMSTPLGVNAKQQPSVPTPKRAPK